MRDIPMRRIVPVMTVLPGRGVKLTVFYRVLARRRHECRRRQGPAFNVLYDDDHPSENGRQSRNVHSANVAAWPTGRPSASTRFQTIARSMRNRRPVVEILTPR